MHVGFLTVPINGGFQSGLEGCREGRRGPSSPQGREVERGRGDKQRGGGRSADEVTSLL